jgi:hypothetical protein
MTLRPPVLNRDSATPPPSVPSTEDETSPGEAVGPEDETPPGDKPGAEDDETEPNSAPLDKSRDELPPIEPEPT